MKDLYELELNVKGLKSLDASLDEYLTVKEFKENNQCFFCKSCKRNVDTTFEFLILACVFYFCNYYIYFCIHL